MIRRFLQDPDLRRHGWKLLLVLALWLFSQEIEYRDLVAQDERGTAAYAAKE
ncbi:hypothetical protein [Bordetella pseudohinzii]|uniref:Uncharacterized protein n=1 Tax=Bordetella pseudohinzii TaxID=1331258 RepID=A0A0M7GMB3_9BORD|nr:hypothetical protein [Bordetella pseudohinzii]CUI96941.1 Uncharacterised protein [Bordetella pseudohinzii]